MAGLLGGRGREDEPPAGLLGDTRKLQALLGYEGMPTPDAAEGMPQYDPEFLKRLGNAIATMPTVQSVKSAVTLPGDVYAGRQPMGLPSETEDLSRVADLAGLAMTGGVAGTGRGGVALGSGPMRRTAELPMDEAARMARAAEQGYTTDAYHGTGGVFDRFEGGAYFTDDPKVASRHAGNEASDQRSNPNVIPAKLRFKNPLEIDAQGRSFDDIPLRDGSVHIDDLAQVAERSGHDGVVVRNVVDTPDGSGPPTTTYITLGPDQVRSRFAAFDPANEGSGMLLGSTSTDRKGAAALSQGLLGNREPKTVWSDLSKNKLAIPLEDMSATRVPTGELLPRPIISPEQLQGSILLPAYGDRTAAGARLTHINERPLSDPVMLEGGPDFMRSAASQKDGSVWASGKGKITTIADRVRDAGKEGDPVNLVYSAMGARSGDFATMTADAILAQMPTAKITGKTKAEFDKAMREHTPDWPGLKSQKLQEELHKDAGMRKAFVEELSKGPWQEAGFPDIASTRFAISEPALLGQPQGASGYAIGRADPSGRMITDPTVPHSTYDTHLGGQGYLGGLEASVPREIMFPDWWASRPPSHPTAHNRSFEMGDVRQRADQQWLDSIMSHLQTVRNEGASR